MGKSRYARLLTHHPIVIIVAIAVVVLVCVLFNVFLVQPPDFSDPIQGFIPRKTEIHASITAWNNLIENTAVGSDSSKPLTVYPRSSSQHDRVTPIPNDHNEESTTPDVSKHDVKVTTRYRVERDVKVGEADYSAKWKFFCDSGPRDGYAKLVFAIDDVAQQYTYQTYVNLCQLQKRLESSPHYTPTCDNQCKCSSFSYVNYIAYLSSSDSCVNVTEQSFNQVLVLLNACHHFYSDMHADCWLHQSNFHVSGCNVTEQCSDSAIYELFHYLIDQTPDNHQALTVSFIHMAKGTRTLNYYYELLSYMKSASMGGGVKLYALDFGLKDYIFENYLITDTSWISLALAIVFLVMWLYTESLFLTIMSLLCMVFAVVISFTIYHLVFRIDYFPFLNLLAAIVVVGLGADDLFIYWKTWTAIKHSRNAGILDRLVTYTFKHASAAMFVTSASTATAFYASSYTDILSVRCFCIFAGTCVLVQYLLVITWLPACVVVYEKYALVICYTSEQSSKLCKCVGWLYARLQSLAESILKKLTFVSILSYVWIPLFLILSVGAGMSLFLWPKLSLPSTDMFQMLPASHPFELYDRKVRPRFAFSSQSSSSSYLPLVFVFGIDNQFNGEYFNINSNGHLSYRPLPDLLNPDVQHWFRNFCSKIRQQPFFDQSMPQSYGCFIEEFSYWLRFRDCNMDTLCCEQRKPPFSPLVMKSCLPKWSTGLKDSKLYAGEPGLRYRGDQVAAIVISFWSNIRFSYNYSLMSEFYLNVTNFTNDMTNKCPTSDCSAFSPFVMVSGGWSFYDIQNTLITSLPLSLVIILIASASIIFLTTLNLLLTICALISICCSILLTLGGLALMGWELNILETVIVTLTVGLSMDYPLHVAVAYRIASSTVDRKNRVAVSLHHVGGSILAAMVTSVIAGLCMLPAHVLAYKQLGLFLILVTSLSWLTAFFFMPSLLVHIGPVGNFSQVVCSCKRKRTPARHLDKTIYSEELSSDAITNPPHTLSSHLNADSSREDDDTSVELAAQSTCLLDSHSHADSLPHHRLSTIEETALSEEDGP